MKYVTQLHNQQVTMNLISNTALIKQKKEEEEYKCSELNKERVKRKYHVNLPLTKQKPSKAKKQFTILQRSQSEKHLKKDHGRPSLQSQTSPNKSFVVRQ